MRQPKALIAMAAHVFQEEALPIAASRWSSSLSVPSVFPKLKSASKRAVSPLSVLLKALIPLLPIQGPQPLGRPCM